MAGLFDFVCEIRAGYDPVPCALQEVGASNIRTIAFTYRDVKLRRSQFILRRVNDVEDSKKPNQPLRAQVL